MSSRSVFLEVDLHVEVVIIVSVVVVEALEYQDGALSVVREHLDLEQISRWIAAVCAFYFAIFFIGVRFISVRFIGLREMVRNAVRIVEDWLSALLLVYSVSELFAALLKSVETDEDSPVIQPVRLIRILHLNVLDHVYDSSSFFKFNYNQKWKFAAGFSCSLPI